MERFEKKGDYYFDKGRLDKAIVCYNKALTLDKNNKTVIHSIGRIYEELGNYEKAIDFYSRSIEIDSNYIMAFRSRGYSLLKLERYQEALKDYLKSLSSEPKNASANRNVGFIYEQFCDYYNAKKYYYESLKYDSEYWRIIDDLANIEFDLGNYDSCINLCYKSIKHYKNFNARPYGTLGLAYIALNKWDSSVSCLTKAIEIRRDFASYFDNRGYALTSLKKYDEALEDFNSAIFLDSLNPTFYLNKADLYAAINKYPEALSNYDKSITLSKLYPDNDWGICYYNRAWTKKQMGDQQGYEIDTKIAKELGYPENYKRFSNLESCFYKIENK